MFKSTRGSLALADVSYDDDLDWESYLDNLPFLYQWARYAIGKLSKYAQMHQTAAPMDAICRAAFAGLHADDVGSGNRYSASTTSQLRDVVVQAKALSLPLERSLALMMVGVYDTRLTDRTNALRQAEITIRQTGMAYYYDVVSRLRERVAQNRFHGGRKIHKLNKIPSKLARRLSLTSKAGERPQLIDLCSLERTRPSGDPSGEPVQADVEDTDLAPATSLDPVPVGIADVSTKEDRFSLAPPSDRGSMADSAERERVSELRLSKVDLAGVGVSKRV